MGNSLKPLEHVRETLPRLFARGMALLRVRAERDDRAKAWLGDVLAARGSVRIDVEGEATVWLALDRGVLSVHATEPVDPEVQLAMAIPPLVIETAVGELERRGELESDRTALLVASLPSGRAQIEVGTTRLDFHLIIAEVPELGEAIVRVGVNGKEPPSTPRFTATIRYEDVEDLHEGHLDPQKLLMGGRIRFGGDYVPALQLGLKIAAIRR